MVIMVLLHGNELGDSSELAVQGGEMTGEDVFFEWSDDYSVNIPAIDEQHQKLVDMLNLLFSAVAKREAGKVIAGILDSLVEYTQTHFGLEERLLQEAGYQEIDRHKQEHRKLIEQLDHLTRKFRVENKPIYFEMLTFLRSWLRGHIMGCDTKYSAVLQQAGFSTTSWERQARVEFEAMAERNKQRWQSP
jgi:hemerythrin